MKHKPIPKSIRLEVYEKCNHRCAYCGCELAYKDMQVDHLIALENGGKDSLENYMPSCRQCNFYKHTYDIETFRYCLENIIMKKVIGLFQFRLAEKYGLVERHDKKIKFYFEELEDENKISQI